MGRPDVDGLLAELTAPELAEWMAYYSLEPWGEERGDLRAGIVAAATLAPWRGKGKPAAKPKDFMPDFDGDGKRKRQTRTEMIEAAKLVALAMGGKVQ